VMVLGAGVVGVTTAFELLEDGHQVTVVDRQPGPARETSFANAGLVAPGHALAWSSPRAPGIMLRSLFRDGQPIRFKPRRDLALWAWSLKFLRQCTAERGRVNTMRKHALCAYSQAKLQDVVARTGVSYDGDRKGLLYLYRTQASLDHGAFNLEIIREQGHDLEVIDRERAAEIDPSLVQSKERIAGAVFCPSDESGDAHKFTVELARLCVERGVTFRYETGIKAIERDGSRVMGVVTEGGERLTADGYVLALGSYSPAFAKQIGEELSVYPIKGYSVTVPVDGANAPPTVGGVDEDNLTAYVRLGDRVRMTSVAEFAGYDVSHRPEDFTGMIGAVRDLFPAGADYQRPTYWACLRPMTPEGTPVLDRGRCTNLWYNTGHGHMGWTMASGSARITADLIKGARPELPLDGMTLR
ncbi:MAG: D-amino acid dehydrogenase, partial [Geminicoccaceae bacterium]|nr:D-amino acid dehydrogenase [Geminicoccaceae bacterium]